MNEVEIRQQLQTWHANGKSMFMSSSFQSHSIPLLHLLSSLSFRIPVYFIDTGFHFPETLAFRDQIRERLDLDLKIVKSKIEKLHQRNREGNFLFTSSPERCCHINKVEPLAPVVERHDVWISGLRRDQTKIRRSLETIESGQEWMKFHPLLDWSKVEIDAYRERFELPAHPLDSNAELSIGCQPCTNLVQLGGRDGRWSGLRKTECGLHINRPGQQS